MLPPSFNVPYRAERPATNPADPRWPPSAFILKREGRASAVREARVISGLILLLLIGILIGFVVARARKRMGLGVTWTTWVTTVVVVGFILLLLYATSFNH